MTDRDAELRALLTRAADAEARRQAAHAEKDWPKLAQCEAELRRLWARHAEIEQRAERVA